MAVSIAPMPEFTLTRTTHPTSDAARQAALADPGFGRYYVDHMVVIDYVERDGWQDPRVLPMSQWQLHPAAAVLHYGQEIFEGLKAYRRADDSIWLFRPDRNAARFVASAQRMGMAVLPEELFLGGVDELVRLEQSWVPNAENEQSLYIRPFMIASEPYLGVREASNYRFAVIATPAGPYYSDPVKLWITPNYTRAAPGGTGTAKCGGNYAASLVATQEAYANGCQQVLWTDGAEHKWVEECGTMNIMFVTADNELLTPSLGSILAGVTRESILALAADHGLTPVERPIEIDEGFTPGGSRVPRGGSPEGGEGDPLVDPDPPRQMPVVDAEGCTVRIINKTVSVYDTNGKLLRQESIVDYTKSNILGTYASLDNFIRQWTAEEKKESIRELLRERGIDLELMKAEQGMGDVDDFDFICHVAFDKKPLTRRERADNVKKRDFLSRYSGAAREVLEALLDRYMNTGIYEIEKTDILKLDPFAKLGKPARIAGYFGGRDGYMQAVKALENAIYADEAG